MKVVVGCWRGYEGEGDMCTWAEDGEWHKNGRAYKDGIYLWIEQGETSLSREMRIQTQAAVLRRCAPSSASKASVLGGRGRHTEMNETGGQGARQPMERGPAAGGRRLFSHGGPCAEG